jgi:hypothetical protein
VSFAFMVIIHGGEDGAALNGAARLIRATEKM